MYISIDRERTRFVHKHADFTTVCELDYIAQVNTRTDVEPIGEGTHFLTHWTELELQLLYKRSITGNTNVQGTVCPHAGSVLRAVLLEMAQRLPATDADPAEAVVQAAYVEERLAKGEAVDDYQYVRGAKTPGRKSSLFPLTTCAILSPEEAAKVAHARITAQATRAATQAQAQASAAAQAAINAPAQPKPVRASAGAPRSGVCKLIWEALDEQVKQANGIIPERSFIKRLAEEKGWKTSTASVQYAAWRKQRSA